LRKLRRENWASVFGPLLTLNLRFADTVTIAKPWAGVRWHFGAAVGAKGAPTALRCSGFGRTAQLASLTAFVALEQMR
jgi:hypothetical protein